ncbi:hypothetical protein NDU88_004839 [Pleurodeles waltl]|uniref:Uncharacterized protein n=1 Tax=Pleurodeles waltl TaxID=8319 RepID=A0AAV7TUW1_PLEWA|nr:hypothetical protein NDU88_004838 [Pleurodeles waltl]KAJ1179605.1 hypothetical protein NDU88_004839 [Pleurodeles waltl]
MPGHRYRNKGTMVFHILGPYLTHQEGRWTKGRPAANKVADESNATFTTAVQPSFNKRHQPTLTELLVLHSHRSRRV